MGAFYGSIHIKSNDTDAIRTAVGRAATRSRKYLLAPELNGWVSLYPINSGQDPRASQSIAKHLDAPILHVALHDDDVVYYWYYDHGKLVDRFCSCPDYFEQVTSRMKNLLRGRPKRLKAITPTAAGTDQLQRVLDELREPGHWNSQGLESFAEVFRLPHVSTSYEDLMAGEAEGIEGWEAFIHFPDLTAERRKEQELLARVQREMDRLKDQGKLLGDLTISKSSSQAVGQRFWSADPVNGLLLANPDYLMQQDVPIQLWSAPWTGNAASTGIVSQMEVRCVATSLSGQHLAVAGGLSNHAVNVWDLPQRELKFKVEHTSHLFAAKFSADGRRLFSLSATELVVTDTLTSQRERVLEMEEGLSVEPHPDGRWVAIGKQHSASLINLQTGKEVVVRLGRYQDLSKLRGYLQSTIAENFEADSPDWVARQAEQTMQQMGVSEDTPAGKRIREDLENWRKEFVSGNAFSQLSERTYQPENFFSVTFAGEGEYFCCATSGGIRAFETSALLESEEVETDLKPLVHLQPQMIPAEHGQHTAYIYCLIEDPTTGQLLYAGLDGVIRGIHLRSGQCSELLTVPGTPAILKMQRAGRQLFCDCQPGFPNSRSNAKPPSIQVWNLDELTEPKPLLKVFKA